MTVDDLRRALDGVPGHLYVTVGSQIARVAAIEHETTSSFDHQRKQTLHHGPAFRIRA